MMPSIDVRNIVLLAESSSKDLRVPYGTEFSASLTFSYTPVKGMPWNSELGFQLELSPVLPEDDTVGDGLFSGEVRYAADLTSDADGDDPFGGDPQCIAQLSQFVWVQARGEFVTMVRTYGLPDLTVPLSSVPPSTEGSNVAPLGHGGQ